MSTKTITETNISETTAVKVEVQTPVNIPQHPIPASAPAMEKKEGYGLTLGSLKKLKDSAREKLKANLENKESIEITDENLAEAWVQLVNLIASHKVLYKSALLESDLSFIGHEISLAGDLVAMDFLKTERLTLLDFFKKHYHNEEINVLFKEKVHAPVDSSKHVPSTRELFDEMAKRNPYLKQLKDSLGLDIEY